MNPRILAPLAILLLVSGCAHSPAATPAPSGTPAPTPTFHREPISPVSTQDIETVCHLRLSPRDYDVYNDAQEAYLFSDSTHLVRVLLRYPQTPEQFQQSRAYVENLVANSNHTVVFGQLPTFPPPAYILQDQNTSAISLRFFKSPVYAALTTGGASGSPIGIGSPPACTPEQLVELAKVAYNRL